MLIRSVSGRKGGRKSYLSNIDKTEAQAGGAGRRRQAGMRQQAGGRKQQAVCELALGIPWAYPKAGRRAGRQEAAGRRRQAGMKQQA